jgi:hypothetical protein
MHGAFTLIISLFFLWLHKGTKLGSMVLVAWALALFDFFMHFMMDRIKASPEMLGRYKPLDANGYANMRSIIDVFKSALVLDGPIDKTQYTSMRAAERRITENKYFWWSLGFDQMVHHLTHYAIIYVLVTR